MLMTNRYPKMSPKNLARLTGVLYLLVIVCGIIAQGMIADSLVSPADASRTASNIAANMNLYRLGYTLFLIEMTAQIVTTMLFYELLKPVSRMWSMMAAVLGVAGSTIKMMARLFYLAPGLVLSGKDYLNTFSPEQLHSLAQLFFRVNDYGAAIALVFFGFSTLIQGWLIVRSTYLPHALGWIAIVGGIGWLTYLWLPLGFSLFLPVALFALLGVFLTVGWLVVKGVDEQRWLEQAHESG